jgi:hypothetical protein
MLSSVDRTRNKTKLGHYPVLNSVDFNANVVRSAERHVRRREPTAAVVMYGLRTTEDPVALVLLL